jgi:uncharacterized protein
LRSIPFEKLSVPLSEIKEGISHFAFRVVDSNLGIVQGRSFPDHFEVNAQFTVVGDEYLVRIEIKGEGHFTCDRCGESVVRNLNGEVQTLYTFDRAKYQEVNSDDVRLLSGSEQEIDIRQDVMDALMLTVPQKVLCQESCKGLCAHCGVNLNKESCRCPGEEIDPRWEALKEIRDKK